MIHLKSFTEYTPESEENAELNAEFSALFLRSQDGVDWYDAQAGFGPDTMKIVYDNSNVIVGYSTDVSTLVPYGCSVVEMSLSMIPETLTDDNTWQFIDGEITPRLYSQKEQTVKAEGEKLSRLSHATSAIAPLQDAVDLDMATEDEATALNEWKKYRVMLSRVKPEDAPDITWPELPA
ncbi:tail fiber assembly protein [Citrobacter portucalensis]|uniref:tail fiber assembly protein n=1 Tax=Citrobacter portucalensis TaxID=1639133 RepID=UPI0012398DEE|nr:tail fiber assembly protein [Citrobacter portucalensis]